MTRRISYALFLIASFHTAQAAMYWCHIEGMFFTHPRPEVHENLEYDMLARKYIDMMVDLINSHKCNPEYALKMIQIHSQREYLAYPNSTLQKFVDDLKEIKHSSQVLEIIGVSSW